MLDNSLYESPALKYSIYGLLVFLIVWLYKTIKKFHVNIFANKSVMVFMLCMCINFVFSPYVDSYVLLLKYGAYILCFRFGYEVFANNIPMKVNKWMLYAFVLTPLILVSFFDHTAHKTVFFALSNVYSYLGLTLTLLLFVLYEDRKKIFYYSFAILGLYILSCSSLGILVAVALSIFIINRRNTRLMLVSLFLGFIAIFLVLYSDISIFTRVRDVLNITMSLTWDDWKNLQDLDMHSLEIAYGGNSDRTDNTSAIWRLAHWSGLLGEYFENWYYSILFGLGNGYSEVHTGFDPHNEYLRLLIEYGMIVFIIVFKWIRKLCGALYKTKAFYFVLSVLLYHLTENLVDFFIGNAIVYFCVGYLYCKYSTLYAPTKYDARTPKVSVQNRCEDSICTTN